MSLMDRQKEGIIPILVEPTKDRDNQLARGVSEALQTIDPAHRPEQAVPQANLPAVSGHYIEEVEGRASEGQTDNKRGDDTDREFVPNKWFYKIPGWVMVFGRSTGGGKANEGMSSKMEYAARKAERHRASGAKKAA